MSKLLQPSKLLSISILSFFGVTALGLAVHSYFTHPLIGWANIVAIVLLFFGYIELGARLKKYAKWKFSLSIKKNHLIQAFVQIGIYVYWGLYHSELNSFVSLIVFQLIFALLFDALISLAIREEYGFSFGVVPVVLSINLFLWFKPNYFYLQLIMIVLAVLAKVFLFRVDKDGVRRHIFNPSAIALTAIAVFLMSFEVVKWSNVREIVASYEAIPKFHTFVILIGSISLWFANRALICIGAVATLLLIDYLTVMATGEFLLRQTVHANVFLSITLLITDPATTPKKQFSQLLFGATYGFLIAAGYVLMVLMGWPPFFDKLIPVPILNFFAPNFDRMKWSFPERLRLSSAWVAGAFYLLLFFVFRQFLELQQNNSPLWLDRFL